MKIVFAILLSLPCVVVEAQVDSSAFQKSLDNILEDITEDKENSQFYDQIEYLQENPIYINSATEDDLVQIPFLDRDDAAAIIKQRNLTGKFSSPDQLNSIPGLSSETIDKILPFITFKEVHEASPFEYFTKNLSSLDINYRSRAIRDLQQDYAYREGKYYGSDIKFYNRLVLNNKENIHAAIVTEKDAGEKSLTDFTSFHLTLKNMGVIQNILIGDYNFEFGQGLALWSRASINKGIETVDITLRNTKGIKPYQSVDENMFFRGAAAKLSYNGINLYSFYSNKFLDGSIDPNTNNIKSLITDGYHRDSSEVSKKHVINEKIIGTALDYNFKDIFSIGFLYLNSTFANEFYNSSILDPSGKQFNYLSANYSFMYSKFAFSGETASNTKALATINSMMISVERNFKIVFSYRNYPVEYWNWHATGFGEKDNTQNESGFYTGVHWRTAYGTFDLYYDQFRFPITSDKYQLPSHGNDFLMYYTVKVLHGSELRLKYKIKTKEDVGTINDQPGLISGTTENYRAEFLYNASRKVVLKTRIEFVNVHASRNQSHEEGFLVYQDVQFSPIKFLDIKTRLVLFKSDSYNSRIYEFENDLAGVMSTPPLYGDGMRWYLMARYRTEYGLNITLKYAETILPNETTLGSGDTLINSNVDNRLGIQLDFEL